MAGNCLENGRLFDYHYHKLNNFSHFQSDELGVPSYKYPDLSGATVSSQIFGVKEVELFEIGQIRAVDSKKFNFSPDF